MEDSIAEGSADDSIAAAVEDANQWGVGTSSFFEDSFSSVIGEFGAEAVRSTPVSSTPIKAPPPPPRRKRAAPSVPHVSSERLPCPECKKTFANARTLAVHAKMHAMSSKHSCCVNEHISQRFYYILSCCYFSLEAASRKPKPEAINAVVGGLFRGVVEEIILEEDACPSVDDKLKPFLEEVLHNLGEDIGLLAMLSSKFCDMLESQNALLPSALRTAILVQTNKVATDDSFFESFSEHLSEIAEGDTATVSVFFGRMIHEVFDKLTAFVLKCMRGADGSDDPGPSKSGSDKCDSLEFKQTVFYISGFIIHAFLRKRPGYIDVIHKRFLSSPGNECSEEVRVFTKHIDRGGLKHCSRNAFDFYLLLFEFLMSLETPQGMLPPKVVDDKVFSNEVIVYVWDELVGSDLDEEVSMDFLLETVEKCSRVVAKGILKRRQNELMAKPHVAVAMRPLLASG